MVTLNKNVIHGIGALISAGALAVTGFLFISPIYDEIDSTNFEMQTIRDTTTAQTIRLEQLSSGVDNLDEKKAFIQEFVAMSPSEKDIASASRAISAATTPGVTVTSFTFGNESDVDGHKTPEMSTSAYSVPEGFASTSSGNGGSASTEGEAATGMFRKMPIQISVNASDQMSLAAYLDSLSKQPRLINVLSVNSVGSGGSSGVTATVYAYAFIYAN